MNRSHRFSFQFVSYGLCLGLTALLAFAGMAHAAPAIRVDTTEFVFGQLPQNVTVSHTFWVYSIGSDTLRIDSIIPGCGCTTIPLSKRAIAPNDSVAFEIQFNNTAMLGWIVKKPSFRTNAATDWQYFKFYGSTVVSPEDFSPIAVFPTTFDFTSYAGEPSHELGFALENRSEETVKLRLADAPPGMLKIALPKSLKPGETYQGRVTLTQKYRTEDITKSLTIEVNNSHLLRLSVPLYRRTYEIRPGLPDSSAQGRLDGKK